MILQHNNDIKILVVEDDEITNYITTTNLQKIGYNNVTIALNGEEAIKAILDNTCPDIILLDLNMPIMDGFEFLQEKENLNLCENTPIIILTSSNRPDDRLSATQFKNVIDYIEKPMSIDYFEPILKSLKSKKPQI